MKRFASWVIFSIVFISVNSEIVGQNRIAKADFLNKSANLFMDNVSADIYSIAERIEPDGSFKIKNDSEPTKEEILKILGLTNDYTFELKRENNSYLDTQLKYKYYQQFYKNIRVEGGGFLIAEKGDKILKCSPNLYTEINLDPNPTIMDNDILNILGTNNVNSKELLISNRFDLKNKLIWIVNFTKEENKIAYIDAYTGNIYNINNTKIPLLATTSKYGTVQLNNFSQNGVSSLSSQDNRIRIYQNINNMNPVWDSSLIPTTTDITTWDNSPTWALSKQALYVTERVDHEFSSKLGIAFPEIRVGTILNYNAFASNNSNDILVGTLNSNPNGANFALYDVIAHEIGHLLIFDYLDYDPGDQNAILHEGLADIYADYIENGILQGGTDWIMGNEEIEIRALTNRNHTEPYCFENNPTNDDHQKSRAISRWFHNITVGIPDVDPTKNISSLGIEMAKTIALEALNRISDPKSGVYYYKYLTLEVAQEMFEGNPVQYSSVLNAWNEVCVTNQCPLTATDITIGQGQKVTYNVDQYIGGNIIIENGGILTLKNANIFLKNGKFIQVKAGGRLNVTTVTFNTCDGIGAWDGIIAEENSTIAIEDVKIYSAKIGIHFKGNLNLIDLSKLNITGNQFSDIGIKLSKEPGFIITAFNLSKGINISGCKTGLLCQNNVNLILRYATISHCYKGIDVYKGDHTLDYITLNNCKYPIYITNTSISTISNNTILGDFNIGINCEKSGEVSINNNKIGSEAEPGGTGVRCYDLYFADVNNNPGIFASNGIQVLYTYATLLANTIDVKSSLSGIGILTNATEQSVIASNYITTNGSFCGIFSRLNTDETIRNNEITFKNPSHISSAAIRGGGKHGGSISQNIINAYSVDGIYLNNSTDNEIKCNHIPTGDVGISIANNSDFHTIKGNYLNNNKDLEIKSVTGEQSHHGNEFIGGEAEAIGLDIEQIRLSRFFVDDSIPNQMPTNPNPANGQWFVSETNPNPYNCNGLIIGPVLEDGLCNYWTELKKIRDTLPNRFFINVYHLLLKAKKDTSFKLPNCIKLDPILTQICGITKITDLFAALTKPRLHPSNFATLRKYASLWAESRDEGEKRDFRAKMEEAYDTIRPLIILAESQDSFRLDSIRQELELINCDSLILIKWKEILKLFVKYKQNDSVDVRDRSAVINYSTHCADVFGDAIYLARMMANSFDDVNYEQYDGCISAPALPQIRAVRDIIADIDILPNPTSGIVQVTFSEAFDGICRVLDITGKVMLTKSFASSVKLQIDLSDFGGINLIQISSKSGISKTFKVVVLK
ncbi:MAG: right-handed parallel beta-helix repeat-containing protein [Saprospiraceae bacterium]|nr:right-handed parallel beta-helix repeat-containing protein [Saprospiraceae bacterium]